MRPRVQIPGPRPCHVSGHRGSLSHDIAEKRTAAERLVITGRIQGQFAEQRAFLCDDADVGAGDEKSDWAVLVDETQADVMEPTQVAESDSPEAVDLVLSDAEVCR